MRVLVHGGAGPSPDDSDRRADALDRAATAGAVRETPLDAVEGAVRALEFDPAFNAGVGGAVQSDGRVRVDAGLMTGDGRVGGVCGLERVEHPVSAARVVLERTPHVLLTGERASALAAEFGVAADVDLLTGRTRERFEAADPPGEDALDQLRWVDDRFGEGTTDPDGRGDRPDPGETAHGDHDTVGAVARDGERFAAATSTGGRFYALAGRVGDVPQVGAGFFASDQGAASATGAGEAIARHGLARDAVDRLAGSDPETAATAAIEAFAEATGETAGVIVVGADGVARAANSEHMGTAVARA